jgi:hypothetical protein
MSADEHGGPYRVASSSAAGARVTAPFDQGPATRTLRWHTTVPLLGPFAGALGLGAATLTVALANPFKHDLSAPCPLHALTGLWCPFCGGTRAVWALTHGDMRLMAHSNALLPAIAVAALWAWLNWLGRATGWWRLPVPRGRWSVRGARRLHGPSQPAGPGRARATPHCLSPVPGLRRVQACGRPELVSWPS